MKQTLKTLIRNVKSINGNSLAEFATTTALMATLAATAAPKLSEMSEGPKAEKSRNEIDKIIKQAGQFYQDKAESEGRGRFPGQEKFNIQVGGTAYTGSGNTDATTAGTATAHANSDAHTASIHKDLGIDGTDGWQQYDDAADNAWISVFGTTNEDNPLPSGSHAGNVGDDPVGDSHQDVADDNTTSNVNEAEVCCYGPAEWKLLMGGEVLGSTFQDGHYAYSVVAGGGSGSDVYPPTVYVVDIENAVDFNNVLEP
ncbi:MAG: hypothetical protein VX957_04865 [Candidatus Neomarinimicrobiota bacterium]|nr:hypothetical protein [Candidatus Neomarinimicrobiota bacterium]